MTAMRPAPKTSKTKVEMETDELDAVIDRIDQSLPIILKKAANGEISNASPSRLSVAQFARAQAVFRDMRDDPLLNESGDDICLKKKKKKKSMANGKHP